MQLFLSSYRLGNQPEKFAELCGSNTKVAVIGNARDQLAGEERAIRLQQEFDDLRGIGLDPHEIDLRDFFGKPEQTEAELKNYKVLWVRGGNTFLLRRALAQSGADHFIWGKRHDDSFVYGGYSAGACVVSPTLQGVDLADDPDFSSPPYQPEVIWEGLNLIPYWIVPHYQSDHFESEMMEAVVQFYKEKNLPYKPLHDGEFIVEKA